MGVLGGQQRLATVQLPVNGQRRIVPGNAALVGGCIVVGRFVEELRHLGQHHKPVRKARWHPQLAVVVFAQFFSYPLAKGRRTLANVHRHINHRAAHHPHQLALGLLDLIVQPPQHALRTAAVVVLHKWVVGASGFVEGFLVETFKEKASSVTKHLGFDDDDFWNGGANDVHAESGGTGWSEGGKERKGSMAAPGVSGTAKPSGGKPCKRRSCMCT